VGRRGSRQAERVASMRRKDRQYLSPPASKRGDGDARMNRRRRSRGPAVLEARTGSGSAPLRGSTRAGGDVQATTGLAAASTDREGTGGEIGGRDCAPSADRLQDQDGTCPAFAIGKEGRADAAATVTAARITSAEAAPGRERIHRPRDGPARHLDHGAGTVAVDGSRADQACQRPGAADRPPRQPRPRATAGRQPRMDVARLRRSLNTEERPTARIRSLRRRA
jgi:hypothetical protein